MTDKASSFKTAAWPAAKPDTRCIEVFATIARLDGEEVFLGSATLDGLESAFDAWVDGRAVFDRSVVQRLVVTSMPEEEKPS